VITINQIITFNTKFYTHSFKDDLQSVNREIHSTVKWEEIQIITHHSIVYISSAHPTVYTKLLAQG